MLELMGKNLLEPFLFFQPNGCIILIHPDECVVHPRSEAVHDFIFSGKNNVNPRNGVHTHLRQQGRSIVFSQEGPLFCNIFNALMIMNIKMFGGYSLPF